MTRNRQEVTSTYPDIADALQAQQASDFITDGEIVAFDGDRDSFYPAAASGVAACGRATPPV
jgi:bifunctional non-homologous end joining protein LigD